MIWFVFLLSYDLLWRFEIRLNIHLQLFLSINRMSTFILSDKFVWNRSISIELRSNYFPVAILINNNFLYQFLLHICVIKIFSLFFSRCYLPQTCFTYIRLHVLLKVVALSLEREREELGPFLEENTPVKNAAPYYGAIF